MRRALICIAALALAGCGPLAKLVATDVQTVDKPVATKCTIKWPARPTPHISNVQLTGDVYQDAVRIWRAMEAEMEERIAYQAKLEAAASACVEGKP